MFNEDAQGLHNVGHVDSGVPGNDVRVDEAFAAKEGQQHQFGLAGMYLGLVLVRLAHS